MRKIKQQWFRRHDSSEEILGFKCSKEDDGALIIGKMFNNNGGIDGKQASPPSEHGYFTTIYLDKGEVEVLLKTLVNTLQNEYGYSVQSLLNVLVADDYPPEFFAKVKPPVLEDIEYPTAEGGIDVTSYATAAQDVQHVGLSQSLPTAPQPGHHPGGSVNIGLPWSSED